MRTRIVASVVLAGCLTTTIAVAQQNPLVAARDLYASARYDEALALLNGIRPGDSTTGSDLKSVEQYRSLCLLALGRGSEAEKAIAAVVTADPAYQPSESEASPRVRAAFSEVRRRLLPQIAGSRYTPRRRRSTARILRQPRVSSASCSHCSTIPTWAASSPDLRILVAGFVDLSAGAAAPAAAPPAAPVPQPEPPAPAPRARGRGRHDTTIDATRTAHLHS